MSQQPDNELEELWQAIQSYRTAGKNADQLEAKDRVNELLIAWRDKAYHEGEINGEIAGLATFAQRDRKSFRVNSSIMSIDSKDILLDIADCYERLAQLKEDSNDA